ncbi:MAG: hypothetical protein K2X03_28350 [Bryobacteraceae bacterium]|nr:hypothetical protein [Bryobacteraceae bacterium]
MAARKVLVLSWAFTTLTAAQIRVQPWLDAEQAQLSPHGRQIVFAACSKECGLYLRAAAGGPAQFFVAGGEGWIGDARWSPDGKQIAFSRGAPGWVTTLAIRALYGTPELPLGVTCTGAKEVSWSRDGRLLIGNTYLSSDRQGRFGPCRPTVFDTRTGQRLRHLAPRGGPGALSPDGRSFAYGDGQDLFLLPVTPDFRPAGPARHVAREPRDIFQVSWPPDRPELWYSCWGDVPYTRRISLTAGARPRLIPDWPPKLRIAQLLPGGVALALQQPTNEVLWQADIRTVPLRLSAAPASHSVYSPDGRRKAFISTRTGVSEVWTANVDGTAERPLLQVIPPVPKPFGESYPHSLRWSPDGKWIAFLVRPQAGNTDVLSNLYVLPSAGGAPRRLGRQAFSLESPVWSLDSRSLVAVQDWSVTDTVHVGQLLVRVSLADGSLQRLGARGRPIRISPDGQDLYFFSAGEGEFSRVPLKGGEPTKLATPPGVRFGFGAGAHGARVSYGYAPRAEGKGYSILRVEWPTGQSTFAGFVAWEPQELRLSADEQVLYLRQEVGNYRPRVVRVEAIPALR